jgi:O-methyltransferase
VIDTQKEVARFEGFVSRPQLLAIRERLWRSRDVPGEVVELGTCYGLTGAYLTACLQEWDLDREVHLYDAFPTKIPFDRGHWPKSGECPENIEDLFDCNISRGVAKVEETFRRFDLPAPFVHPGWFSETLPDELPDKICFAHLDSDHYESM